MRPRYLPGNRLTLLRSGAEYFPALEAAIRDARQEIYLESYIYADDEIGRRITQVLCDAARRGVVVHLLVDGFGAHDMPESLRRSLDEAGVQRLVYRPEISRLRLKRHRLRRMHRKLAVADGSIAFVGGINIIDDVDTPGHTPPRYDYAVMIEGPLVRRVLESAERLWSSVAWVHLRRRWRVQRRAAVDDAPRGGQLAAFVERDNIRHRDDIEEAYLEAIDGAREEIILANAYFLPGIRFRRALARAAERGVEVTLLLQGRVEYTLLHYASRGLYGTLLQSGVHIYEYHKSFMHAKVAVVDRRWATVGSSNIDPFSLMLAREANVVVDDRSFADELRRSLHTAIEGGALMVARPRWFRQPLWRRLPIWFCYGLSRLLIGMVGYGGQH